MNARPVARFMILVIASVLAVSASAVSVAKAQQTDEFRVETDVFDGDAREPVSETLTLFSGDLVYDFLLTDPEEITILDLRRNRIVQLDTARRVQMTLETNKLLLITAALKALANEVDPKQKELFQPQFVEQFEEESGELVLGGVALTYSAKGIAPKYSEAARQYREFADWYARLNAARLSIPPFARIELNRALFQRGLVPQEVARTVVTPRSLRDKRNEARSQHSYIWSLSSSDRKRIESAGTYQATFKTVPLAEYWGITEVASRDK